jgi:transcriptional regulator GlxA family with amidase domain
VKICIVVFDGTDELDFVAPYEVFQRVAERHSGTDVAPVTAERTDTVTTQPGLKLPPSGIVEDSAELVRVPGGGSVAGAARGVRREIERGVAGKTVQSITCAGITSGLDPALWTVERKWGVETASDITPFMEYTPSRVVYAERVARRGSGSRPRLA